MGAPTPAVAALLRAKVPHRLHHYDHDPGAASFGDEAVTVLGVDAARVHKTLVVDTGDRLAVAVVPVASSLDLKACAAALGAKRVTLADAATAERATGYVLGGISPLGQKRRLPTVVDDGATAWPTIFVSGGRRGLEIELAPTDLVALLDARLAPVAR